METPDTTINETKAILYDLSGRVVMERVLHKQEEVIDTQQLQSGYYLLELTSPDGKRQTFKLTKE